MVKLTAEIERFESNAEKTGWTYVFIPQETSDLIKSDERRGFRVRGFIDQVPISGMSVMPVKPDGFIIPLNQPLRKALRKEKGASVEMSLEFDADFKIEMPTDLEICLAYEEGLLERFLALPKSHQNYFINWLNTAKTEVTRTKRILMIVNAIFKKFDFGMMIREERKNREEGFGL